MMLPLLISASIAFAVLLIIIGVSSKMSSGKDELRDRLKDERPYISDDQIQANIRRDLRMSKSEGLNYILERVSVVRVLDRWIISARVASRPGDVIIKSILLAGIGGAGAYFATGYASSGIIIGTALGSFPVVSIVRKRRKRMTVFARQLPDAMTMMKNALKAGHTLTKAMQIVAEEMANPAGEEFRDTVEELRLGLPISQAMTNFTRRMPNDNLDIFVAAVLIQHEVGGNLTELLENISKTIRERFRLQAEVKSLTAEGRISGIVIAVLPIALCVIISLMQPDYLVPLFKTETGNKLLLAATISETIGFLWIRKVCKVKF